MNHRGSILLHVLVTGVIVALIAGMIMRITLLRYVVTSRTHKASQMKRYDEAALARIHSSWSNAPYGGVLLSISCADNVPGYRCSPPSTIPPGACDCTCTPAAAGDPTVIASAAGSACQLRIDSVDMP
ncbi:MAG TPA: hypothetical protein DCZ01_10590 [Elusimicrobia bacterium]|nr:MAG: hypothetical protein A2X37_11720 [Elusimicrobia bacterium GWA2_66_18]HAZ08945.1 hypothetical protein [Elusimicrobiota bacterium]